MEPKKRAYLRLTLLVCLVVLLPWSIALPVSAQPALSGQRPDATVFGPATVYQDETLTISGFNNTDRTIRYRVDVRDALSGESIADDGAPLYVTVGPKRGFTGVQTPPTDLAVVIAIAGIVVGPPGEEIGGPAPPTPLSVEVAMGDGPIRSLLPAVQHMSSGREGSSGEATIFGPATIYEGETLAVGGFNTTDRPISCRVDVRDTLTGGRFAERGEMVLPRKGFVMDFDDTFVVHAAAVLAPTESPGSEVTSISALPPEASASLALIVIVCVDSNNEGGGASPAQIPVSTEAIGLDGSVREIVPDG